MKLTGYYTDAGEKIAAGLLAGATLSVTRITAGSGSTALSAAALDQEQQNLGPCEPEVSGTTAVMRCTLSSDQAKTPYFLPELGVYALDDTEKEVLYLIFRLDEEVSINPAFRLVLRFNLEQTLSDGAGVKVTAPLTGLATQEDLKTKADLVVGQIPYGQTNHLAIVGRKTIYVDAASGDDSNPGTQDMPFRTIQAAVDSLPRNLGVAQATILVADGTYPEHVLINGFTGGAAYQPFILKSASGSTEAVSIGSISIANCAATIRLEYLSVTGDLGGTTATIGLSGACADLYYVTVNQSGSKTIGISVGANGHAQAFIYRCTVDGYSEAGISVLRASVANITGSTLKNNAVGVKVSSSTGYAGIAMVSSMTYEANTSNSQAGYGGQIFGGAA